MTDPTPQDLVGDLGSAQAARRLSAIKAILTRPSFEDREVPQLVKALHGPLSDPSVEVRYYARKAFSRLQGLLKGRAKGLILPELLDRPLDQVQQAPTFVYGTREYWLYELDSVDYKLRVKAVMELARRPSHAIFERIAQMASKETHPHVLATIAKYLAAFREPGTVDVIATFLSHEDPRVRANAIEGLESLGDPAAMGRVIPCLTDQDNRVRANATKLLIGSHPAEVRRTIQEMLGSPHVWMRDSALYILSHLELSQVEDLVLQAADDTSPEIVVKAVALLGGGAVSPKALAALEKLTASSQGAVADAARRAVDAVRARTKVAAGVPPGSAAAPGRSGRH